MKNMTVLIVEDHEINRMILKHQLNEIGIIDIFEKEDGRTAIEFLVGSDAEEKYWPDNFAFPPDIILLDLHMPNLDGIGFLEEFSQLRIASELKKCVVFMYTSSDNIVEQEVINKYGFVKGFFMKGKTTAQRLEKAISAL